MFSAGALPCKRETVASSRSSGKGRSGCGGHAPRHKPLDCPSPHRRERGVKAEQLHTPNQLTIRNTRAGHPAQRTVIALQVLAADEHRGQLALNLHHADGVVGYRQSKTGCGCVSKVNEQSTGEQ